MYPAGIARSQTAQKAPPDEDLLFLHEQARRYVDSRAWERLGSASVHLDLKVGSWHETCAQAFSNGPINALFLFPGRRDLRDLQKAGMGEPPPGTIFAELHLPTPGFQVITPEGWYGLERRQAHLLALAFAAITDLDGKADDASEIEATGELEMPGKVRGRFRARRAPADPNSNDTVVIGSPRTDLYGDDECILSLMTLPWSEYFALRERALLHRPSKEPLQDRGEVVPVVALSGPAELATAVADKLQAAAPLGIILGEMDGYLGMIAAGPKDSYLLMEAREEREQVLVWWHGAKSSAAAYALVVADTTPAPTSAWNPSTVSAIFEFGDQRAR